MRALRASRALRDVLAVQEECGGLPVAIGVATGTVIAGNIGARDRYEYTVIGQAVNRAARLTDLAKTQCRLLPVAESIRAAGDEAENWVFVESVALRGMHHATDVFEPAT